MEVGGRRTVRCAAAALAMTVALGGCASDDPGDPGPAGAEATEAAPTPSPSPTEASPKARVEKTLVRFTRAVKDEDARTTANLLDRATIRYLKRLRRDVGSAGAARIARLSPWDKLALTGLRTDFDERTLGALSVEGFLDHLLDYEEIFLPWGKAAPRRVRIRGPHALVVVRSPRLRLRFELRAGTWRMDARPLFRRVDAGLARLARARGNTVDDQVLMVAEQITRYGVLPDVWEKPE